MFPQVSQTLGAFLTNDSMEFVQVSNFTIEGTYQYYSFVDPNHVDSLSLIIRVM
jgi:hypothetical protein